MREKGAVSRTFWRTRKQWLSGEINRREGNILKADTIGGVTLNSIPNASFDRFI
jgi:hypothetical protein